MMERDLMHHNGPMEDGKLLMWDATCTSGLLYLARSTSEAVAAMAETRKREKSSYVDPSHYF